MFGARGITIYRRFVSVVSFSSKYRAYSGPQFIGTVNLCAFSTSSSINSKVREAVNEFIEARKVELKEYQSTNPPDSEEVQQLLEKLNNIQLTETAPFTSMGLDGLDEVELVLMIESKFGITLSDSDFHSVHSIADAARVISGSPSSDKSGSK